MALPSYHVQNFVHDSRFPYALYWDFCKKTGRTVSLAKINKNFDAVISIRVTPELKKSLKHLAEVKGETISDLFLDALQYQAEHQLDEIKQTH